MRKAKKEIKDNALINDTLAKTPVGRLGTTGRDGYPRIKPLTFVHAGRYIYFHSAMAGEKIEDILRDDRVCFVVDAPLGYVQAGHDPCSASYHYQSILVKDRAESIEDPREKHKSLEALMEKYQPSGGYGVFPKEKLAVTAVIRITIEAITGKQDLPEG